MRSRVQFSPISPPQEKYINRDYKTNAFNLRGQRYKHPGINTHTHIYNYPIYINFVPSIPVALDARILHPGLYTITRIILTGTRAKKKVKENHLLSVSIIGKDVCNNEGKAVISSGGCRCSSPCECAAQSQRSSSLAAEKTRELLGE